jgi:hypothetical protein
MLFLGEPPPTKKKVYTMDERQLLRLWSVIRCFAEIRESDDPITKSEILTKAPGAARAPAFSPTIGQIDAGLLRRQREYQI